MRLYRFSPDSTWLHEGMGTLQLVRSEHHVPRHHLRLVQQASTTGGPVHVLLDFYVDWRKELSPALTQGDGNRELSRAFTFEGEDSQGSGGAAAAAAAAASRGVYAVRFHTHDMAQAFADKYAEVLAEEKPLALAAAAAAAVGGAPPASAAQAAPSNTLDIAIQGTGCSIWGGGAEQQQQLLLSAPFPLPLPPVIFRHLRLSLRGGAALGATAHPTSLPVGWLSPQALAAAAAAAPTPLSTSSLARAYQGLTLLSLFVTSCSRETLELGEEGGSDSSSSAGVVGAAAEGEAASASGGAAPPPPLRLTSGAHLGATTGSSGASSPATSDLPPFSPCLVAPLICPNTACSAVLAVDLPDTLPHNRGLHVTCTTCDHSLCGHCGAPWLLHNGSDSHAGIPCSEHSGNVERERGVLQELEDGEVGFHRGALKRCPNPTCRRYVARKGGGGTCIALALQHSAQGVALALALQHSSPPTLCFFTFFLTFFTHPPHPPPLLPPFFFYIVQ